ncbi:VOC family protein [Jeotgalibacillus terrae]|uniref:VOC family protein n=1 Tax=Jeotgalibacillus terrae TaxID=587735 RepID=A0ABW5ZKB7_9BACL|nr:VOC family protein [Jeotgalibacillus terrae]MBM7580966.1 catechol 2,3-dioxygenase-like lactoylglutathione lyase family enzyme [Jeotgalibacillus terrae]
MENQLIRVGTTYIPVSDPRVSAVWYKEKLGAKVNYKDQDKAIIDLAGQSFFLVKASENEKANFFDQKGAERFSLTFEVDGIESLKSFHHTLHSLGVKTGVIENRGHAGRNFVFSDPDGNLFDVWSELSAVFKKAGNR